MQVGALREGARLHGNRQARITTAQVDVIARTS